MIWIFWKDFRWRRLLVGTGIVRLVDMRNLWPSSLCRNNTTGKKGAALEGRAARNRHIYARVDLPVQGFDGTHADAFIGNRITHEIHAAFPGVKTAATITVAHEHVIVPKVIRAPKVH